jgi:hypothetical protein
MAANRGWTTEVWEFLARRQLEATGEGLAFDHWPHIFMPE